MYGVPERELPAGGEVVGEGEGEKDATLEDVLSMDNNNNNNNVQGEEGEEEEDPAAAAVAAAEDGQPGGQGSYEYSYRAHPNRARGGHRTGYGAGAAYYGGGGGEGGEGGFNASEYVMVDAHVLASPTMVDINGDGHMEVSKCSVVKKVRCGVVSAVSAVSVHQLECECFELVKSFAIVNCDCGSEDTFSLFSNTFIQIVFSVSYYFDRAEYAGRQLDYDPEEYVAGGLACWEVDEQRWTWLVHLDLTTSKSK